MQENINLKSDFRIKVILKRVVKLFLILFVTAFITLLSLIVFLKYFIPTTLLKEKIETFLSATIKGEVKISSLYLDPFTGIGLQGIHVKAPGIEKVDIDNLIFKYDFFALLKKEIIIDEVEISNSNIYIILPKGAAKPPEKTEPFDKKIPEFPFSMDLKNFSIINSNLTLKSGEDFDFSVKQINFDLEGGFKDKLLRVSGKLATERVILLMKQKSIAIPLSLDFNAMADLKKEEAVIDSFNVDAGLLLKASVNGKISQFFDEKKIDVKFFKSRINLERIIHVFKDFVPAELYGLRLSGVVEPEFSFQGEVDQLVKGKISLAVKVTKLTSALKKIGLSIDSTDMNISLPEVKINGNEIVVDSSGININSTSGKFKEYSYKELKLLLSPKYIHKSFASLVLDLSAKEIAIFNSKLGIVKFPFQVNTEVSSDLANKSLQLKRMDILADGIAGVKITAAIDSIKGRKKHSVKADISLSPDIEALLKILPQEVRKSLNVSKKAKDDSVILHLSGVLGSDFKPESINLEGDLLLSESNVSLQKPAISVKLVKTALNIESKYSFTSKKINAKVTSGFQGSKLKYGEEISLGGFDISVDSKNSGKFDLETKEFKEITTSADIKVMLTDAAESKIQLSVDTLNGSVKLSGKSKDLQKITKELESGKFSSLIEIKGIRLKESKVGSAKIILKLKNKGKGISNFLSDFMLAAGDIRHEDKKVKVVLKNLDISGNTALDINRKEYSLTKFKVNADDFLKASGKGFFDEKGKLFSFETKIPRLNISKLGSAVSGESVKKITDFNPEGIVDLSLKGSGRVPEKSEMEAYIFPFAFDMGVSIKKGGAKFPDGVFFKNAKFSSLISFDHNKNDSIVLDGKLQVKKITLSDKSPIKKVKNFQSELSIKSENFNEVEIEKMIVKSDGANFSLTGNLDGLPDLASLSTINRQKVIQKVYANLNAQADLRPEEFSELLKRQRFESRGKAGLSFDLRKTEKGEVDALLSLNCEKLDFRKGSIFVNNASCLIPFHKNYHVLKSTPAKLTYSSNSLPKFISRISHSSKEGHNLFIKNIDLDLLKISNLTANVSFESDMLKVLNLAMNLLDGGVGGQIFLKAGTPFGSSSSIQIADININKLLPQDMQISGDASVSGIINTALYLREDAEGVDFEMMDISLEITKIGRETLDRLLLFIDPEESKPAVANARAKIKFANPSTVKINLKKGIMGFEIEFQQGIMSSLKVDRIPVVSVKNLKKINSLLAPLSKLAKIMELIAEENYFIEPDGKPVISKK